MSLNQRGKDARKKRGSILLLAIFFLIVLFSLSVAFFRIIPAEYHSAERSRQKIQASYAADSGVRHALEWLRKEVEANTAGVIPQTELDKYNKAYFGTDSIAWSDPHKWGNNPSVISNAENKVDADWSFSSCIRVDNPAILAKIYTVESCAYFHGRPMQVARVTLQNSTFAQYALFISEWDPAFVYGMQPNGIQGPVHTNTFLRVQVPDSDFWTATKKDGSPEDPWVSGPLAKITQAGSFLGTSTDPVNTTGMTADGIQYLKGNSFGTDFGLLPYDNTGASNSARYNRIVSGGRDNIRQVNRVELPSAADALQNKAWGGDLPTKASDFNTATNGDTLLVMTDTGKANDGTGKVVGGIYITGSDTKDTLLDITPDGNQKIRIRQGKTTVAGADKTTYYADIQAYVKPKVNPAWDEATTECKQTETVDVPVYTNVKKTRSVTRQDEAHCGSHDEWIAADNGISTKVKVIDTCTFDETYYEKVQTGTKPKVNCVKYGPGPVIHHPETTTWVSANAGDAGAVPSGSPKKTVVDSSYPGAYAVTSGTTKTIDSWSSVVEVNDKSYQIPYHDGVTVNGVAASGPTDPILTVTDGHTVAIKNDTVVSGVDYAEYTVMEGRTNGVVFSDVNINNLRGTNKGAKYEDANGNLKYQGRVIAADISDDKNPKSINIKDSILQYYDGNGVDGDGKNLNDGNNRLVVGNESPTPEHILGLIGTDISIAPGSKSYNYANSKTSTREGGNVAGKSFLGGKFKGGINVYAILMAGKTKKDGTVVGGFGAANSAMDNNDNLGDFNLYGGDISGVARKTQTYSTSGSDNNGFRLNLNYDKMAAAFLDYFPPTNQFVALRYVTYTPKDLDLRI